MKNKLAIKLCKRLKTEFDIDVIPKIYRTYAGFWQRAEGTWSWFMLTKDNRDVGSLWSVTKVLKAKELSRFNFDNTQTEILIEKY